jgi:hypothetical protein
LAWVIFNRRPECSVRLYAASKTLRKQIGFEQFAADRARDDARIAELRNRLGDEPFEEAWRTGQGLPQDLLVVEAMALR